MKEKAKQMWNWIKQHPVQTVLIVVGTVVAITLSVPIKSAIDDRVEAKKERNRFIDLLRNGSDEELHSNYEERRIEWLKNGGGDRTPEMEALNSEINRRSYEKWVAEHPNATRHYREHGWYLPNDD